jgi:hypothetical protein
MRILVGVLGCLLAFQIALCAQAGTCTDMEDKTCADWVKTTCTLSAQWLKLNESCPKGDEGGPGTHAAIALPKGRTFKIPSLEKNKTGPAFQVEKITQYKPIDDGTGKYVCDWDHGSAPADMSKLPFTDADGFAKFKTTHNLTATIDCFGCYELELFFEKSAEAVDPHIQTGGNKMVVRNNKQKLCPLPNGLDQ